MDITVKVKIGNVEVELSLEEAAELHAVLGRIVGKPETVVAPCPYPVHVPYHEPRPWWQGPFVVTCGTSSIRLTASEAGNPAVSSGTFTGGTFTGGTITGGKGLAWTDATGHLHVGGKVAAA